MSSAPKAFASQADLEDKKITFEQLSAHCWAYTAEGDPNSGVIIGDKFIMVSDATATPVMAQDLIARIRTVSNKPIKYVLLTHYHAVRVLGASAYVAEGATEVIASQGTYDLIVERGAQDMQSEMERFPRLFRNSESVPGLTWPTMVIGGGNPTKNEVPGKFAWEVNCILTAWTVNETFEWRITDVDEPGAVWRFDLAEQGTGSRLRMSMVIGQRNNGTAPAALKAALENPAFEQKVLNARRETLKANMQRTIEGIKVLAETAPR